MTHAELLKRLLPPVAIDPAGAAISAELAADGAALDAAQARAAALLREMDPRTVSEMLSDWERVYGLPDECAPAAQTIQERVAALVAKVTARGGLSAAYFIGIAERLGYPGATVTLFRPANCNDNCNAAIYDEEWRHAWQLNLPQETRIAVANCNSACDEPLRTWGDEQLECTVTKLKPAQTQVLFSYGGA